MVYSTYYSFDLKTGEKKKLFEFQSQIFHDLSDKKEVVFVSEINGQTDLVKIDASGKVTNLTNTPDIDEGFPSWSPDSSTIAFVSKPGNKKNPGYVSIIKSDGSGRVDFEYPIQGLNDLRDRIPRDIPPKYAKLPSMKPHLSTWEAEIDSNIYLSVPGSTRLRIGEELPDFKLTYLPYDEFLIINGVSEVLQIL